jgi:hypothetical protein
MMDEDREFEDLGKCRRSRCGGQLMAIHVMRWATAIGPDGKWFERLGEFARDVDVICAACGRRPIAEYDARGAEYSITWREGHDGGRLVTGST